MKRYWLWRPEYSEDEDDGRKVMGRDPADAVQRWAEHDDARCLDYTIVSGTPAMVMLRDMETSEVQEWIVSGEKVAKYSARLVTQNDF